MVVPVEQRYKKIRLSNNGSTNGEFFRASDRTNLAEGRRILSSDIITNVVPFWEIERAVRNPIQQRHFRLLLLHEDETPKEDITSEVVLDASLTKTYNQGLTRTMNVTFNNPNNVFTTSPISGKLWANTKFLLQIGMQTSDAIYYVDEGIYVCNNPSIDLTSPGKPITLQLYDKFALLDGTISGTNNYNVRIPRNTPIETAINMLIRSPKDNFNNPYDSKAIIFPFKYKLEKTTYTIYKTNQSTIGEILIDLANIISCDIFYDGSGHLNIVEGNLNVEYGSLKIAWTYSSASQTTTDDLTLLSELQKTKVAANSQLLSQKTPPNPAVYAWPDARNDRYRRMPVSRSEFSELEFSNVRVDSAWEKIFNRVIVKGANSGMGFVFTGMAENTNPASAYNVNSLFGIKEMSINEPQIQGTALCRERARYELKKNMQKYITLSFDSIYIPHLEVNDLVRFTYPDIGIFENLLLVQSVTIPFEPTSLMNVTLTNVAEIIL